jgi:hypothetical protein
MPRSLPLISFPPIRSSYAIHASIVSDVETTILWRLDEIVPRPPLQIQYNVGATSKPSRGVLYDLNDRRSRD